MNSITQSQVRELFSYDPDTGIVTRRITSNPMAPAGTEAGSPLKSGHLAVKVNRKSYKLHAVIWLYVYGYLPKMLDHKNGVPNDNRLDNLRLATTSQNMANRVLKTDTASGLKGAYPSTSGRWYSRITKDGAKLNLGTFDTAEQAHCAYMNKARELFGEFAFDGVREVSKCK
jgi:hypothetical protein